MPFLQKLVIFLNYIKKPFFLSSFYVIKFLIEIYIFYGVIMYFYGSFDNYLNIIAQVLFQKNGRYPTDFNFLSRSGQAQAGFGEAGGYAATLIGFKIFFKLLVNTNDVLWFFFNLLLLIYSLWRVWRFFKKYF